MSTDEATEPGRRKSSYLSGLDLNGTKSSVPPKGTLSGSCDCDDAGIHDWTICLSSPTELLSSSVREQVHSMSASGIMHVSTSEALQHTMKLL